LKGRISVYKDARLVWIVGSGFFEGSPVDFVAGDAYPFGLVFVFGDAFDVTSVRRQMDLFFADVTFTPFALVTGTSSLLVLAFGVVDLATLLALFVSFADGVFVAPLDLPVSVVAWVAEEFSVTR